MELISQNQRRNCSTWKVLCQCPFPHTAPSLLQIKRERVFKEHPLEAVANFVSLSGVLTVSHCDPADTGTRVSPPLAPNDWWRTRCQPVLFCLEDRHRPALYSMTGSPILGRSPQEKSSHLGFSKCSSMKADPGHLWSDPSTYWQLLMTRSHPYPQKPTLLASA